MITEAEQHEDLQYIRSMTGATATVLTISTGTILYSISTSSATSHSCLLDDMPLAVVCGIHPKYSNYTNLGEDTDCKHLQFSTVQPLKVLDLRKRSLIYSSRLYRSLILKADQIDGVLCRSWYMGPLELILYRNSTALLKLTSTEQPDYSSYESLDEWTTNICYQEAAILDSALDNTTTTSL